MEIIRAYKAHVTPSGKKKIKSHRDPNTDLLLEFQVTTKHMHKQLHWVGSHQDKDTPWDTTDDLLNLQLSPEATLNVLCDKMAMEARLVNLSDPEADVLPSEKWTLFSCSPVTHKITCKLETALMTSL